MREALLFVHPTFGVFGMLAALWVFVEAYRLDERRLWRMKVASVLVPVFFVLSWFSGGLWDAFFYDADRELMNKGAWAFIGNATMELKEHLFVLPLLLGLYLPILAFATDLKREAAMRLPITTVAGLIVLLGVAMEGAGAILAGAVHIGVETLLGS